MRFASPRRVVAGIVVALGVVSGAASRADEYASYSGTATALDSRKFLYGEQHVFVERDGKIAQRVVLYTCRNGSAFARKTVSYVNQFAPNFSLEDASNGMREGIRDAAGGREVYFRGPGGAAEKRAPLPNVPALVADAGFDEFVRANWRTLADHSMSIRFLVPSRLDDIQFHIEEQHKDAVDGVPVREFRLNLAGVLGWFLSGIDVYYGTDSHVLMRFVGLSDLRDASGENYKVDIGFDPKDRKVAAQDDVDRALKAPLAPCT